MLNLSQTVLLILTVAGLSAGQVLFKIAATRMDEKLPLLQQWLLNGPMIIALVVYGLATVCWINVLKQVPLRMAYPFVALAFFMVPRLSHWLLGEDLSWRTILGAGIIGLGVWVSVS